MKKLTLVFFLFFISIMIGGEIPSEFNKSYSKIEKEAMKETQFIENSVKIQYISNLKLEEEKKKILNKYKDEYKIKTLEENTLILKGKFNIQFHIWIENEKVFVEGIIDNNNSEFDSKVLENQFKKLIDQNTKEVKVFNYYKGKKLDCNLEELKPKINEKLGEYKKDSIDIENGITGKIKFEDGTRLNYSVMEYDTGIYLIIGTPIIFKAY